MNKRDYLEKTTGIAFGNVEKNIGGPFGAIVVKKGQILAVGRNLVTAKNDPTAHDQIQAIRGY